MISIERIEYAANHKIVYRIIRKIYNEESVWYEAQNEMEVHKVIDHYLHAADHNFMHYKDCPWCRKNYFGE